MQFDKFNNQQQSTSQGFAGFGKPQSAAAARAEQATGLDVNVGLRNHFLRVYRYLGLGIGVTGLVTYLLTVVAQDALFAVMGNGIMPWVFAFMPLGFFLLLGGMFNRLSAAGMMGMYMGFSVLMAFPIAVLTSIAIGIGEGSDIARAFFVTAAIFGGLSFAGYTTKRDLSGFAAFFLIAIIGLFITGILNLLIFQSSFLSFALSALVVLVFAGLVAYDTQQIKRTYLEMQGRSDAATLNKLAVMGAAELYFDVIVIFKNLLYLFLASDD